MASIEKINYFSFISYYGMLQLGNTKANTSREREKNKCHFLYHLLNA